MHPSHVRGIGRLRRRAAVLLLAAAASSTGCSLIPTVDDVHSATLTVKDTITGRAKRDRQTKLFSEARILERRKEFAAAEFNYRELLKELPQNRDCYHRLAVMAAVQGKFDEANILYRSALECGRPTADLWSDVGYCNYLQQQLPQAEQALKHALELEPQNRKALNNLGLVVGEAGNLDEAYRLFRQANKEGEAEANFAFVCAQCGDLERAQKHYSLALSYDPELKVAAEALLQVTQRMQLLLNEAEAAQQAAAGNPADGQVRPVSYDQPVDEKPKRPLIEVYTAGAPRPMTAKPEATAGAVAQLAAAQSAQPIAPQPTRLFSAQEANAPAAPPAQNAPPIGFPQPHAPGQIPGAPVAAPQPFNFPAQQQPAYLQPTSASRSSMGMGGGPANGPANGSVGQPMPNGNVGGGNPGALLNAGGPFPPLVGGASMTR